MKLGLIFAGTFLAIMTAGCAANPGLQAQVDSLKAESAKQDKQIEELSASAAKCSGQRVAGDLKQDASDLATAAWSWLSSTSSDAYRTASPIISCYRQGSGDVHSLEQAQALMSHCYHESH